jgi:succinate dehydrogenase/fumarate reductase flavoprotein subunit
VATLITHAAWIRTESRGCHSRLDYPERDDADWLGRTVLRRGAEPVLVPVHSAPGGTGGLAAKAAPEAD